jgi:hypothetical protein
MNRTFKTAVVALILAVGIVELAAAGPAEDGSAAYKLGDYLTAMRFLRPLPIRATPTLNSSSTERRRTRATP